MAALLVLLALTACSIEREIKKAESHLKMGEYHEAALHLKKAYNKTSTKNKKKRAEISIEMGKCYAKIGHTPKAITALRSALRICRDSNEVTLLLAEQLMKSGIYKEAEELYKGIKNVSGIEEKTKNGIYAAQHAPQWRKEGSRYIVSRATEASTDKADYSPVLVGEHADKLYFSSTSRLSTGTDLNAITGMKFSDIFVIEKNEHGQWSKPKPLEGAVNTSFEEGACCFTPDGETMYFSSCAIDPDKPSYARIMRSQRTEASWGKPEVLEITSDTLSSYAHPAISPDGKWLYFVSDMPGGLGGTDIWRVRLMGKQLGGVENLGKEINTVGNEMFPTFRPNGDLYFSSDTHPGLGGLDIFVATLDPQTRHYHISHPGYPLNSMGDDSGMTFEGKKNKGFFASNRNDTKGCDHIYRFENPEIKQTVKGWVYEKDGYELPQAVVHMVGNDGTNIKPTVLPDGSFTADLKPGIDYLIMATCHGFLNHKEQLKVSPSNESHTHVLQFELSSISAPVLIDNIFYDLDKATLRPESQASLDKLIGVLQENPHVTVEIGAHCDYRGSENYNLDLSRRRAESVVQYLATHGIAKDRLQAKGYGKSIPKTVRKKLTEKYDWLKEDDILSEDFIKDKDKERQEICNQLNRRTEFRVTSTTYGLIDDNRKIKEEKTLKKAKPSDNRQDIEIVIE